MKILFIHLSVRHVNCDKTTKVMRMFHVCLQLSRISLRWRLVRTCHRGSSSSDILSAATNISSVVTNTQNPSSRFIQQQTISSLSTLFLDAVSSWSTLFLDAVVVVILFCRHRRCSLTLFVDAVSSSLTLFLDAVPVVRLFRRYRRCSSTLLIDAVSSSSTLFLDAVPVVRLFRRDLPLCSWFPV